ncbi:hypothetical protein P175DRAFT_0560883 [Aspergillus ochraceoroseus IBT 24754]|uniref:Uncharacterized protein n=1 Tax=Aspergillus ochraceoroseus IBT 24754 TaxID=1392256 RepID=A0A2T5LLN9_9EURO|nr:uncharacterized protein P175DRAFT_0560883 [Aspergillus ochraceoroseus IBT 24754]PTU17201.1 hypothetical protein P175DRAFT_0560883 [Aspergillus ochraceoroseus IBT 24754]
MLAQRAIEKPQARVSNMVGVNTKAGALCTFIYGVINENPRHTFPTAYTLYLFGYYSPLFFAILSYPQLAPQLAIKRLHFFQNLCRHFSSLRHDLRRARTHGRTEDHQIGLPIAFMTELSWRPNYPLTYSECWNIARGVLYKFFELFAEIATSSFLIIAIIPGENKRIHARHLSSAVEMIPLVSQDWGYHIRTIRYAHTTFEESHFTHGVDRYLSSYSGVFDGGWEVIFTILGTKHSTRQIVTKPIELSTRAKYEPLIHVLEQVNAFAYIMSGEARKLEF